MISAVVAGLVAGYGVAVPVGAIGALIVSLTARTSLRVGAAAGLGVATADGVYALLAVVGGAALAGYVEPVAGPLRIAAVAVLLMLAARTTLTAIRHYRDSAMVSQTTATSPARAYLGLLGLTLLNPATVIYFAALVLARRAEAAPDTASQFAFVLAAFVASASWQLLLAGGGSLVGRVLTSERGRLVTALVSATVIAALALTLVLPR